MGDVNDVPAFARIAEEHLDAVYRYLLLMTKDPHTAEDLTSETFEKAYRSWSRFDPRRAGPRTWLCQIARTCALDHFRAEERRRRREDAYTRETERPWDEHRAGEGFSPALERGLRELNAAEREIIALRVVLELEGAEAARLLGISRKNLYERLARKTMNDER